MELISTAIMTSVGKSIGDYLINKSSDHTLQRVSFKMKVKKIIRQDKNTSNVCFVI